MCDLSQSLQYPAACHRGGVKSSNVAHTTDGTLVRSCTCLDTSCLCKHVDSILTMRAGKFTQSLSNSVVQVLAVLLSAYFSPAAESVPGLSQCLSIFFPAFASAGAASHRILCSSAIPAARLTIIDAAAGVPASKVPAPRLLRYISQLLEVRV